MPAFTDITGRRFGELTVEKLAPIKMQGRPAWVCICDCGERKICAGATLKAGGNKTCGKHKTAFFVQAMGISNQSKRKYPKGTDTHSRVYTLWRAIKYRCYDPTHEAYSRYGGAGIVMCNEWLDFGGFREWALASGYSEDLTVDRIDNALGYEPSNCRWATPKEQARNRKKNVYLTAFGERKLLIEWASDPRCSVSPNTLRKRLQAGHDPEFAITTTEAQIRSLASIQRQAKFRLQRCST